MAAGPLRIAAAASLAIGAAALLLQWRFGGWLALAGGVTLLALLWQQRRDTGTEHVQLQQMLDAMQAGVALFDADDRLVLANADFRTLYAPVAHTLKAGQRFEDLLRAAVAAGLVPEAVADDEAWIAERVRQHRSSSGSTALRVMRDGRWRRIIEQRLADGRLLAFSVDVSELVEKERALDAEHKQAEQARQLLRDAIEAMPAGVEVYDAQDRLVVFNRRLSQLYPHLAEQMSVGHTFEQLVRRSMGHGLVPEARGREEAWLAERMAQRGHHDAPLLQQAHNGAWLQVYETRSSSGAVVGIRLDVTDQVRQREALRVSQERAEGDRELLEDAIEALPEGFALYDADDCLVVCNQRYRDLYRESAPAFVPGTTFEAVLRYGLKRGQYPQGAADPEAWLAERLRRHRHPDGQPILQELPGNRWLRIDERQTRSGGTAGVRTDVTEMVRTRQQLEASASELAASRIETEAAAAALREANAKLERQSTTDPLTDLANRRLFDEHFAQELRRAHRQRQPMALLFVDVDHFKRYNDHYGHPAGDAVLRRVAALLQQQARRPGDLAARVGGEEFALLLPHADQAAAIVVAERCLAAVAAAAIEHAASLTAPHLTLSIGVAVTGGPARGPLGPAPQEDAAAILARADAALYEAKQQGRARAVAART